MHATGLRIKEFLRVENCTNNVPYEVQEETDRGAYRELLIRYKNSEDEEIPAFLLLPKSMRLSAACLIHHQHNGERHLGKSEVAGRKGNPLQAFGPILAEKGFVVLAPDSICFEDRRVNAKGTEPDAGGDWLQHFNEMAYRIARGDTLMHRVLSDASYGLSLLLNVPGVDSGRVGVLGHSYGGNTALFQAAVDERVRFAGASGALCSYRQKMKDRTGLEMALVIPDFCREFEMEDVVKAIAPRDLLVVSASDDPYSKDADAILASCESEFDKNLAHFRYDGGHALTKERFNAIVEWILIQESRPGTV